MGNYVSPFASGGGSGGGGGGGGSVRNPGAGYTSPRMAGYTSPFSTKNYNIAPPPDPMKSGFSIGSKQYKNVDDYTAQFDKLSQQDRLAQYNALKQAGGNNSVAQGIVSHLDQNGRSQHESVGSKIGNFAKSAGKAIADPFVRTGQGIAEVVGEATGVNQQIRDNNQKAQQSNTDLVMQAGKKMKDPTLTQTQRDRWAKVFKDAAGDNSAYKNAQDYNNQQIERTDPVKGAAAIGDIGLQVLTAGTLGAGATAAKVAAQEAAVNGAKAIAEGTAKAAGRKIITNIGQGALQGGVSAVEQKGSKVTAKDIASGAAGGAVTGGALTTAGVVGGKVLGTVLGKGAKASMAELKAAGADASGGAGGGAAAETGPKLLGPGAPKPVGNESTSIVKGDPGTPKTIPVSDAEYTQRFNALAKSYDQATKVAQQQKGTLAQQIAMDQVHESHLQQLEQLNHEYQNGKPNPDYQPATPDKTVQSGFQIVSPEAQAASTIDHHAPVIANDQRAQLHQRVGQIDSIIKDAQTNGTTRTPDEMRALMRERADAQHVLDGNKSYEEVYGKPGATKPLPFGDKAPANAPTGQAAMPHPNEPIPKGSSMIATLPKVAAGDTQAPILHQQYIANQYDQLNNKIQAAKQGMTPHDIKLIESIESATPQTAEQAAQRVKDIAATADNPAKFTAAVGALKDFADARLANDTALGRDVGQRQNYLSRFYQRGNAATSKALDRLNLTGASLPGYTKERNIATQAEADALAAMKNSDGTPMYPHLQRANANVFEDAQQAADMAKADHGKQAMKLAMEQAHPGVKVGVNKIGFDPESGLTYKGLDIKGGNGLSLPKYLADHYNGRAPVVPKDVFGIKMPDGSIKPVKDNEVVQQLKATGGKLVDAASGKNLHDWKVNRILRQAAKDPVGAYDKLNANLKYSILGGGTFHAVTTAGSVGGQQAMRALTHPLEIPSMIKDNLNLVKGTVSKASHDQVMAAHEADGSLGFAHMTGVTLGAKDIIGDANSAIVDKMKNSPYNPIKQVHDAVFGRQIPEAKMMILKQSMASKFGKELDYNHPTPEQVAYGRKVASAVNNLGGINRAVEGLSPATAKRLSRVLLATDFTEGKMRIMGNALTKGGPQGNIARQMVIGKSILFALPGLAAATASGQLDWSKPDQVRIAITNQILDPSIALSSKGQPTKSNPGGATQAIHFPSTFISEFGKILKPALDPLAPNKAQGAIDYVTNRVAAAPAIASRLYQNKDFFGNPIYGQDKAGNEITPGQTALNIANQVAPIPLVQGAKQASGQQTLRDTALNVAGLRVATDANAPTGQHTQAIKDFYTTLNQASAEHTKVSKQITTLLQQGNPNQAYRVAQQYNDNLPNRLAPFQQKYQNNYNPAWDTEFSKLKIPLTDASFRARQKSIDQQQAILR